MNLHALVPPSWHQPYVTSALTFREESGKSNTSVILKLTLVSLCVGVFLRGELLLQVMECLWKLARPHLIFQPLKGFQKNSQALPGKTCVPLQRCLAESQSLSAAVWPYNIIEDIKITSQCCHYSLPLHLSCYFCRLFCLSISLFISFTGSEVTQQVLRLSQ